jgi:plasmid stabilization system protein ParE
MCALAARAPYTRSSASLSVHGKYHVEITQTAEGDVDEIWTHISADSVENATRFVMQLEGKIGTLERMPPTLPSDPRKQTARNPVSSFDSRRLPSDLSPRGVNCVCFAHRPGKPIARYLVLR